jgi:hypothetical protein
MPPALRYLYSEARGYSGIRTAILEWCEIWLGRSCR